MPLRPGLLRQPKTMPRIEVGKPASGRSHAPSDMSPSTSPAVARPDAGTWCSTLVRSSGAGIGIVLPATAGTGVVGGTGLDTGAGAPQFAQNRPVTGAPHAVQYTPVLTVALQGRCNRIKRIHAPVD